MYINIWIFRNIFIPIFSPSGPWKWHLLESIGGPAMADNSESVGSSPKGRATDNDSWRCLLKESDKIWQNQLFKTV